MLDHVEQDGWTPLIEYQIEGVAQSFLSFYGGTHVPHINSEVVVWYDPVSLQAEWYSITNRWLFTIVPGVFCIFLLFMAWFVPDGTAENASVIE